MPDSPEYPSMAIVVPVYNEGRKIEDSCKAILSVAEQYPGRAEVVAVDDGSRDESASILTEMTSARDLLDRERHTSNLGYGAACRTGAAWARSHGFDYVGFIDSDLTNPPEDLLKIGALASAGAQYVKASRFMDGGGVDRVPLRRRTLSRVGYRVGSLMFGLHETDITNGFRAARTELYCRWQLRELGFAIIMEEVFCALEEGVAIVSFPTILRARADTQRGSAFAYTPRVMRDYLRYPLRSFVRRYLPGRRKWSGGASANGGGNRTREEQPDR
jgi:dolichol-phosphate mannosyltransferase